MSPELRAQTIAEWNDLGFWYDNTPESGWVIRGEQTGLEKLATLLDQYAKDRCADNDQSQGRHRQPTYQWHQGAVQEEQGHAAQRPWFFCRSVRSRLASQSGRGER